MQNRFEYGTRRLDDGRYVGTVTRFVRPMESVGYYETHFTFANATDAREAARMMALEDSTVSGGYIAAAR